MKILVVVALVVGPHTDSATAAELCAGHARSIAPEIQVREDDLTREAAAEAADQLADRIRKDALEGEAEIGVVNAQKTIEGYLLRRQAERSAAERGPADPAAAESRDVFCTWLTTEGFWLD